MLIIGKHWAHQNPTPEIATVPIAPMLVALLREHKLACPPNTLGLAFPSVSCRIGDHSHITQRSLCPAMIKAGLVTKDGKAKYGGLDARRHFYASWCINRRADVRMLRLDVNASNCRPNIKAFPLSA